MLSTVSEQRAFFSSFLGLCESCGEDSFRSALAFAREPGREGCPECRARFQRLHDYWVEITGREEELRIIAEDEKSMRTLRRVMVSFSEKGVHRPIILPSTLKLELTNRCNLHCKHCLANANLSRKELTLEQIRDVLAQGRELGVRAAALVGGEPFVRQDIKEIIGAVSALGMVYSISTNGTLLDEERVKMIRRPNLVKVSVSLDGDETYHNHLRGHPRSYEGALRGIRLLSTHGIRTAVAMVINRDNWRMVESAVLASIENGAAFFMVNDMIPVGRGIGIADKCLSYPEYEEHTRHMRALSEKYGGRIRMLWKGMRPDGKPDKAFGLFMKSICGAGLSELTIDHEGYVQGCPFLPKTGENVLKRRLKDIWYHSGELAAYQTRCDLEGGCGACSRKLSCSGCRARALGHTGSLKGPDVRCPVCQKEESAEGLAIHA
jgi:MoaA/NifB/PqqE/SkfB family radical SAM enzyme